MDYESFDYFRFKKGYRTRITNHATTDREVTITKATKEDLIVGNNWDKSRYLKYILGQIMGERCGESRRMSSMFSTGGIACRTTGIFLFITGVSTGWERWKLLLPLNMLPDDLKIKLSSLDQS